jgi:hypothetical protein
LDCLTGGFLHYRIYFQIAVYVIKKKGFSFHELNALELNMQGHEGIYTEEEFKQRLESIISVCGDAAKRIRKSTRLSDHKDAVSSLFREQDLLIDYEQNLDKV